MKIIVNDTNILIDLISIDLFDDFLKLNFEFHTNDLIINEITELHQKEIINDAIAKNNLFVTETKAEDYPGIIALMTKNLSFEDCSIWHYTKKVKGVLLTGDAKLRKSVENDNIEARGILFIFDKLVENKIVSLTKVSEKLNKLASINTRLPKREIEKRLAQWKNE